MKAILTAFALVLGLAAPASAAPVLYVVDGDTIRMADGRYVRIIGIDTPERGQCGYDRATSRLRSLVADNGYSVRLVGTGTDHYGRLLRYVHVGDRDAGRVLLRRGLANARYDSYDGYDFHPRQYRYRAIDARVPRVCPALD